MMAISECLEDSRRFYDDLRYSVIIISNHDTGPETNKSLKRVTSLSLKPSLWIFTGLSSTIFGKSRETNQRINSLERQDAVTSISRQYSACARLQHGGETMGNKKVQWIFQQFQGVVIWVSVINEQVLINNLRQPCPSAVVYRETIRLSNISKTWIQF